MMLRNLMLNPILALMFALLSLQANAGFSFLDKEPKILPAEQAYLFDFNQDGNKLELSWTMAGDTYYLYKDKFRLQIEGQAKLGETRYPQAIIHFDDYFGDQPVYFDAVKLVVPVLEAAADTELTVTYQGCIDKVLCYPPTKQKIWLQAVAANDGLDSSSNGSGTTTSGPSGQLTEQDGLAALLAGDALALTLATFFGLGILLAFTPCVFPMYPILTGIIAGQGKQLSTGKAFSLSMIYVQGMALTYSLLGLVVASAGVKYQAALQQPAVLIGLAILFVVLSLSMFGLYNLQLPSSLQSKLNNASNSQKGGSVIGVFVMGLISGLVASPCTTAPLSGALIYVAQSGDLVLGGLALYALSMGMGLPLLLLGTSGGKLLPRAGAWMETIKHVFGFLLIAVAIMLLDRIWPGLLMDLIWALWGVALAVYLLLRNRSTVSGWQQSSRALVLLVAMVGSLSYGVQAVISHNEPHAAEAELAFIKIKSLDDLKREVAKANADGKPVMLDLYADWCVACKEFEHKTFPTPQVTKRTDGMVMLQADVTANDELDIELLDNYQVLGLPTLLFFNVDAQEQGDLRVTGFMGPNDFAQHLDLVLTR